MSSEKTTIIKLPGPMRIVWGSLSCFWLAEIVNAGFFGIGILLLLLIPVLVIEKYFPGQFEKMPTKNSV